MGLGLTLIVDKPHGQLRRQDGTDGNGTWNEVNLNADSSCFAFGTPRGMAEIYLKQMALLFVQRCVFQRYLFEGCGQWQTSVADVVGSAALRFMGIDGTRLNSTWPSNPDQDQSGMGCNTHKRRL